MEDYQLPSTPLWSVRFHTVHRNGMRSYLLAAALCIMSQLAR